MDDAGMPVDGILTVYFWQDEPDHDAATMWWLDDLEWPTEEP
jgi:hypothetical protein